MDVKTWLEYRILILFFCCLAVMNSFAQVDTTNSKIMKIWEAGTGVKDTSKSMISSSGPKEEFKIDTIVEKEESPLDIATDRGLYITTEDGKMQLRILGSVRFSALYDMVEMPVKNTFNTYYIPTGGDNKKVPNYYNSLSMTRLGFEVTRKLQNTNAFIRLETDFNGNNGQFRIRHAYGQIGSLLVGQTWSLLSNVSAMPVTVDGKSATGSVKLRTPQIRWRGKKNGMAWALALEYSQPDLNENRADTIGLKTVQMIPDLTARVARHGILGEIQLSAIVTTISIKDAESDISNRFGFGGSLSGAIDLTPEHQILYQFTGGKAISHYISTFSGTGTDAAFDPSTNTFRSLNAYGGFMSYGFDINEKISACTTFGAAYQSNRHFQPDNAYRNSISFSFDTFWEVIEGARIGLEYAFGQRWDKDGTNGQASRFWALFYYDF